jgi:hypothetical protein
MRINARFYRLVMTALAAVFGAVGLLFLFLPDGVTGFFNSLSARWGMAPAPLPGHGLFVALAVAYMYLVTLLAAGAARHPEDGKYAGLLVHAKIASSALSFGFYLTGSPYLVLLANGIVDGSLGLFIVLLARSRKR